jgi:hypothetical protein
MLGDIEQIYRLAASVVIGAQSREAPATVGVLDSVMSSVDVQEKVVALADALYASEEHYAMQVCFDSHRELGHRGAIDEGLPDGEGREIYEMVAGFIASLVPPAEHSVPCECADAIRKTIPNRAFNALAGTLQKAGYLNASDG